MNTNNNPSLLSFSVEAILAGPGPRTKRFKPDCDSEDGGSEQHLLVNKTNLVDKFVQGFPIWWERAHPLIRSLPNRQLGLSSAKLSTAKTS